MRYNYRTNNNFKYFGYRLLILSTLLSSIFITEDAKIEILNPNNPRISFQFKKSLFFIFKDVIKMIS